MSDLISRQETINFIRKATKGYHAQGYKTAVQDIIDILEQQDTAYNVDKVVEKLECSGTEILDEEYSIFPTYMVNQDDAIEIVKGGGINE